MKIAFLSSLDLNLYLFRLDIMMELIARGNEVYAIVPKGEHFHKIEEAGVKMIDYNLSRGSLSPFSALSSILELRKILKSLNLDVLHTFTVKPNIFGTIAGKMAKVPRILNLVEGLGSFYVDDSLKSRVVRRVIERSYKFSFRYAEKVVFVNSDDPKYLVENGILEEDKVHIIKSVGIDTAEYKMENISDEVIENLRKEIGVSKPVVLMIARAILHKGTEDFYKSAKALPYYDFVFVGDIDEGNKFGMSREFMSSGSVKWLGFRNDIAELISISDLVVLPSYREGVPRTLLEAGSMGKPIVTTDTVGCREVVKDGENGFLVPVADWEILAKKIEEILENRKLHKEMSLKSREIAEKEFDIKNIVAQYMKLY
jgi:N,N'-diacetylbacillosaminyl-diphospho-undecaprenol alpha-1,3-N-acetylgalactosaminyltransferase